MSPSDAPNAFPHEQLRRSQKHNIGVVERKFVSSNSARHFLKLTRITVLRCKRRVLLAFPPVRVGFLTLFQLTSSQSTVLQWSFRLAFVRMLF